jgi:adenylate kinase
LEVDKNDLLERLDIRGEHSGRADDNPEVLDTRFQQYKDKTEPLVKYFDDLGALIHVDGTKSIEEVHNEILEKLKV